MSDLGNKIEINYITKKINSTVLGESIKATQRFLLGVLSMRYVSSEPLKVVLHYKREPYGVERTLTYEVFPPPTKEISLWRQKLPPGITASEFWVEVFGRICKVAEIHGISCIYDVVNVGFGRGM